MTTLGVHSEVGRLRQVLATVVVLASSDGDESDDQENQDCCEHPARKLSHRDLLTPGRGPAGRSCSALVADLKEANDAHFSVQQDEDAATLMTGRQKIVLGLFGLAFLLMMYGVIPWEEMGIGLPTLWWWFPEMTALFILFSVLIGAVGRMSEGTLTDSFVNGARDLFGVALIIGIARGITVVMTNGGITDTVLHWAEQAVEGVGPVGFAIVVFLLFLPLSFLIPSSSGLATVAMPIMAPLAAFVGVQADLVVTAFQSASGLMNLFIPTSAVVMGGLALARVPYGTYLRWVWPLLAALGALCIVVLGVGAVLA